LCVGPYADLPTRLHHLGRSVDLSGSGWTIQRGKSTCLPAHTLICPPGGIISGAIRGSVRLRVDHSARKVHLSAGTYADLPTRRHHLGAIHGSVRLRVDHSARKVHLPARPYADLPTRRLHLGAIRQSVRLRCTPKGVIISWVRVPSGQWSVGPVAGRRRDRVTDRVEALRQTEPWAGERIDGP
jgi:hypothetical protein